MSRFDTSALTKDRFLGGQLALWQPKTGYRAGVDPVLLAASVPARSGQTVLELGCGAGAAILCLGVRVPGLALTGIEVQPDYADLARQNAAAAGLTIEVHDGDLSDMPQSLRGHSFDHVIANPPYFRPQSRRAATDAGRETALAGDTPLATWIDVATRRLAPKGYLHLINRIERMPEALAACMGKIGSVEVLPLAARKGRAPHLMILRARKSGRAAFKLLPPVVLHMGDTHERDGDSYTPEVSDILRNGAALTWPRV